MPAAFPDHAPAPARLVAAGKIRDLEDLADVLRRVINAEFPADQLTDYLPGPQAEIELHLTRVPQEPFVQLQQLLISQCPFPAGRDLRGQLSQPALAELALPFING
jgi:hypothetical protein